MYCSENCQTMTFFVCIVPWKHLHLWKLRKGGTSWWLSIYFVSNFWHHGSKRNPMQIVQNVFGKDCKNHHILKKNSHMSPYLDNEFLLVVRIVQEFLKFLFYYLTFSQMWIIPLVDDNQSTYLAKLRK